MNKDQVIGTANNIKGKVKVAVGKASGHEKLKADGEADKVKGKLQKSGGDVRKAVRDT